MVARLEAGACECPPMRKGRISQDQTGTQLGGNAHIFKANAVVIAQHPLISPEAIFFAQIVIRGIGYTSGGGVKCLLPYWTCCKKLWCPCNSSVHWEIQGGYLWGHEGAYQCRLVSSMEKSPWQIIKAALPGDEGISGSVEHTYGSFRWTHMVGLLAQRQWGCHRPWGDIHLTKVRVSSMSWGESYSIIFTCYYSPTSAGMVHAYVGQKVTLLTSS